MAYHAGIEGVPALIYFILLFFVPESPRFLVMKNRIVQAKEILMQIDDTQVEQVVGSIQQQIRKNITQKGALLLKIIRKLSLLLFWLLCLINFPELMLSCIMHREYLSKVFIVGRFFATICSYWHRESGLYIYGFPADR